MNKFYTSYLLLIIVFVGCKSNYDAPCRGQAVQQTFKLTSADAARFPFANADTIGFVSNTFDTILFYTDTVISFETYKRSMIIGNPECPADADAYTSIEAQLRDSVKGVFFWTTFSKDNDSATILISNNKIQFPILTIGDSTLNYLDSVLLNNKTFYSVNTILTPNGDSILVNASNGLIYFIYAGKPYHQFKFNSK